MSLSRLSVAVRGLICCVAALVGAGVITPQAQGAFHLWNLNEIYTNSSGTLQFIELQTSQSGQQFVGGQQIVITNIGATQTHTFTIPSSPAADSTNRTLLFGTAGLQAAGGPAPDFIIPNGFLFSNGGTINFFGTNSGGYTALPTDGILARVWGGNTNASNTPRNYAGVTGFVPGPGAAGLLALGGLIASRSRRRVAG